MKINKIILLSASLCFLSVTGCNLNPAQSPDNNGNPDQTEQTDDDTGKDSQDSGSTEKDSGTEETTGGTENPSDEGDKDNDSGNATPAETTGDDNPSDETGGGETPADEPEEETPSDNSDTVPETITIGGKTLNYVWSDEFTSCESDGTPLKTNWNYDVGRGCSLNSDGTYPNNWAWGNNELQWYSNADPDNTYVSDGTLKINAIRENQNDSEWSSARIVTRNVTDRTFKYGYIEMKAKIPYEQGVWPAFWMLDNDIYDGQDWPLSGEIDIMESSVNLWGTKVYGTLHCKSGYGGSPVFTQGTTAVGYEDGLFHTYAVNWTEDHIDWYYDGNKMFTYTPSNVDDENCWPYNENFYIIINLAVGGNLGGTVPSTLTKSTMEIDYVRVYQQAEASESPSDDSGKENDSSKEEASSISWDTIDWIPASNDKFKIYFEKGNGSVVNVQTSFGTEQGIYVTFPAAELKCDLAEASYAVQGAGMLLYTSAFTKKETTVNVTYSGGSEIIHVYYADGN